MTRARGPSPARASGPGAADRSPAIRQPGRTVRSWPLLVLAAPAAAEVWSGWVGIAQKTGFGLVSPLPGIWPSLHLDTSITLPVGVEAYAAYALRAWLAGEHAVSRRTRRFAKWSAVCSFGLGMAGQVAYHLLAQAGAARAPWAITTIVSCLPVLVLAMGTTLAHMLRADAATGDAQMPRPADRPSCDPRTGPPKTRAGPARDQTTGRGDGRGRVQVLRPGPECPRGGTPDGARNTGPAPRTAQPQTEQARLIARRLAESGNPVSRRALRSSGARGSNEALNALAREVNTELTGTAAAQAAPRNGAVVPLGQAGPGDPRALRAGRGRQTLMLDRAGNATQSARASSPADTRVRVRASRPTDPRSSATAHPPGVRTDCCRGGKVIRPAIDTCSIPYRMSCDPAAGWSAAPRADRVRGRQDQSPRSG